MKSPSRDSVVAADEYTDRMHSFRGCYHYESSDVLERALSAARDFLDDEELTEFDGDLFARFQRRGCTLTIDATLPMAADRYFVVAVLGTLAWHAREGVVEAYRGEQLIDRIMSAGAREQRVTLDWG
jgi:hypothetical protein